MDLKEIPRESTSSTVEDVGAEKVRVQHAQIVMPENLMGLNEAELKKLGRKATIKLDCIIMPCVTLMYILNYLDRQNIASAKLADITQDLDLSGVEYQTSVSILFAGYILMQVPSNIVVGKIQYPAVYICLAMATWGLISALMAVVQGFGGLLACRFMLGFVEAVFFPGALYFLSMFYSRQQFALRTAILYSGSQLGNAFGGLFAIGILELDGRRGLEGWRWLFLIEGAITIFLAIVFAFILPNSIHKLRGFSSQEKAWVAWNFESDLGQQDDSKEAGGRKGLMLALMDPKMWMFMALLTVIYISAAVNNFFPSVVGGLGYSRNKTYGLTAPPFVLCVFCMLLNGFHSDKKQERYLHIVCPLAITVVANVIAVSTLNIAARYVAMMLMPGSFYAASVVVLSWITGSLSQPAVKRAAAIATINAVANTPNIWTSYLYRSSPRYILAFAVNLAAAVLAIVIATVIRIYLRRLNVKLDRGEDVGRSGPTEAQRQAGFRYTL
ncbi:hypothetical protein HRR83_007238 [Exophiala dermatitidis]|uniref:Retrograde regulation protein 2 n=2 Tax=Exophiala dermatitidis TaxID=5970 RepID=H6C431_EXODN|nr:retrograde regulation protein 2 [Exophiala dermatitidis NIH/UT8656]KAJ4509084.1 hypothetical protein HRR75_006053 [Exophiala dermatitidis]EHY58396.1 retrograde regulation protein 2 [Exophiala dermatitidis NIH/UT8656]KAJ4511197.1 hypothetical protein HRR73_006530 [Exophiala dermatitidis]KAJ4511868.1 hypothetical protein HRR74_006602 [Exophiala dermatitidis]KAJ4545710.1 hypothetical protein HRR78_005984 [Exophiala dermatitidis]